MPLARTQRGIGYLSQHGRRGGLSFDAHADICLLDEPNVGLSTDELSRLPGALKEMARAGAVVVITHDLSLARAVGDDVIFLCAGSVRFAGAAKTFFETPPDELAARFVKQGNCWPAAPALELPSHHRWVLDDALGGMGRPGLLRDEEEDFAAMAQASLTWVVSLTEEPLPAARLREFGLQGRHFPIPDMGVPGIGPTAGLCAEIVRWMASGERVVVHCHAGLGRTGTILAATLVWIGRSAEEAIAEVRAQNPRFIQSTAQLDFVRRFADTCGGGARE
jgi:atypical dual specificity phosphatase